MSAAYQREEIATIERGWAKGNGDGPQWEPDEAEPRWSKRSTVMRKILEERFDHNNDNLDLIIADMHIIDEEFAQLCNDVMGSMLEGSWKKGSFSDYPEVVN